MSDDLLKRLCSLHKQATVERSHFYVGSCAKDAMHRIEELETRKYHDAWLEVEIAELEAKLAKAMQVVEMIASADVDAVLGQAVDLSCEIIGELMEDEDDE